jgi:perosamine synthetase
MIPVNQPLLDGNEEKYLLECIRTGWISSEGPFVAEFESKFSKRVSREHGIAVSNGTAAIDIAVTALELKAGDEVIMPTFTIISCISELVRIGVKPVLIDCDATTWNMDASQIEAKITNKTKAIMVVHIYGLPVDMVPVLELADRYKLKIIEDAAEMHGQTYNGRPCGSFGDVSIFSFYPNKHITTGEGGMIVTNDAAIAERCRSLRNLCFKQDQRFVHDQLGWNCRMTNLQAALGLAQLERLDEFVQKKRSIGEQYNRLLKEISGIQTPLSRTDYSDNIYWVFGLVLEDSIPFDAKEAMARLGQLGIGTRPFFWPMHQQPVLLKMGLFQNDHHPVAERIARRGFYVPSGMALEETQLVMSVRAVIQILK